MATYCVTLAGNDSTGTGSKAAPWLTLGKALTTLSPSGSGDIVAVGAGIYRSTTAITPSAVATVTSPISVVADVDGSITGAAPGDVYLTGYDTNDTTLPAGTVSVLTLTAKNYYTFTGFMFVAGKSNAVLISGAATNLTFTSCTFLCGATAGALIAFTANTSPGAANLTFNSCHFQHSYGNCVNITLPTVTGGSDYNAAIAFNNCQILSDSANAINVASSLANANFGGGISLTGCVLAGLNGFVTGNSSLSTTFPAMILGCVFHGTKGLSANTTGQITDSGYNYYYCATPLTNVTAGTGSKTDYSTPPLFHFGQEFSSGMAPRHFLTPLPIWPGIGIVPSSAPASDLLGRPRPSGNGAVQGTWTPGPFERHDLAVNETSTVPSGQTHSLKMTGSNDLEIRIPVSAAATTISVQVQWDASYGAAAKPKATLLTNNEIGVTTQSVSASGSSGSFNTITLGPFTPTGSGEVIVRLTTLAAATGVTYWGGPSITPVVGTTDLSHFTRGQPVPYWVPTASGGGGVSRSRTLMGE